MTAAEKYAELEALGLERPVCECHGKTMNWKKDVRQPCPGRWLCSIKCCATSQTYYAGHLDKERRRNRGKWRRDSGWYDEGGMATKPMQAKELI